MPGAPSAASAAARRPHIARAALEGIAYQTLDIVGAMQRDAGITLRELKVDGGAARNNLLMQFQSDLLGTRVIRPGVTETTALGAALPGRTGRRATGGASTKSGSNGRRSAISNPRPTARRLGKAVAGWEDAVRRVLRNSKP